MKKTKLNPKNLNTNSQPKLFIIFMLMVVYVQKYFKNFFYFIFPKSARESVRIFLQCVIAIGITLAFK